MSGANRIAPFGVLFDAVRSALIMPLPDIAPVYRDRVVIGEVSPLWETLQLRFPGKAAA